MEENPNSVPNWMCYVYKWLVKEQIDIKKIKVGYNGWVFRDLYDKAKSPMVLLEEALRDGRKLK